jgi:hypothetical protein
VDGYEMAKRGIILYHYSLVFPKQVIEKSEYYGQAFAQVSGGPAWASKNYRMLHDPFRVHNVYRFPSWLERFEGENPPQVQALWADIANGQLDVVLRPTDDIQRLLNAPLYRIRCLAIKHWDRVDRLLSRLYRHLRGLVWLPIRAFRMGWRKAGQIFLKV